MIRFLLGIALIIPVCAFAQGTIQIYNFNGTNYVTEWQFDMVENNLINDYNALNEKYNALIDEYNERQEELVEDHNTLLEKARDIERKKNTLVVQVESICDSVGRKNQHTENRH